MSAESGRTKDIQKQEYMRTYRAEHAETIRQQKRQWRLENPEKVRQHKQGWYERHRETIKAKARTHHHANQARENARSKRRYWEHREEDLRTSQQWRLDHPERARFSRQRYYQERREQIRAAGRIYYAMNRAAIRMRIDAYAQQHPEVRQICRINRRARLRGAKERLTAAAWQLIKALYEHRCVYCGQKTVALTQDHVIPLRKGGTHTIDNVVPACRACNIKKGAGAPLIPVQPLLALGW